MGNLDAKLGIFNNIPLTPEKLRVLGELSKCPNGSCAMGLVMPGGTLAALVQMGLAKRVARDRVGGGRYAITDEGMALLPPAEEEAV